MVSPYRNVIDERELVEFASELIKIDTTNPPGNETACSALITRKLQDLGMEVSLTGKDGRRLNVIGEIGRGKKSICLTGHTDVVPAGPLEAWTITHPFKPLVKGGKLYGRGASDDKGPLVALYGALKAFLAIHPKFDGRIYYVASADEEEGSEYGWLHLLENGLRFDAGLVADGGKMNECIYGEKGICQIAVESKGKQAHASRPHLGVNAVVALARLIALLSSHEFNKNHPEFSPATMNIGPISGGTKHNVVPSFAEVLIDFRLPLGVTHDDVIVWIEKNAKRVKAAMPKASFHIRVKKETLPHLTDRKHPIFASFKNAARKSGVRMRFATMGGNTDAKKMALYGIPAVVHHPADNYATAHMANEYIEVKDLVGGALLYAQTLEEYFINN